MTFVEFLDKHFDAIWWLLFWYAVFSGFQLIHMSWNKKDD